MAEFALEDRRAAIPVSKLPYPAGIRKELKYWFWKAAHPFHPFLRDALLWAGILHHVGRQDFILGRIAPEKKLDDLLAYLHGIGFGNHFVAWIDEGELIGLRRLDGFEKQYHLRIFKDGEVRGHYEFTPESHPVWHFNDKDTAARRDDFLSFLGNWITPSRS